MNIYLFDYIFAPRPYLHNLKNIVAVVNNWWSVILFKYGVINSTTFQLKDGREIQIKSKDDYSKFFNTEFPLAEITVRGGKAFIKNGQIHFSYKGRWLRFVDDYNQRGITLRLIRDNFIDNQYSMLNVKDRIVVDLGASVGDSAIYFALNGAKHVYAFEPFPYTYMLAEKNVRLNGLARKITVLNGGIGKFNKRINITGKNVITLGSYAVPSGKGGRTVKIFTLKKIFKDFKIEDAVVKSDCEGAEYDFILGSSAPTLRRIKEFIIEYHRGYKDLERRLNEIGFKVKHNVLGVGRERQLGFLYAHR